MQPRPIKQPAVIPVFFAAEMWERFGFYVAQGLLVLYMTSAVFGFSDEKSYAILGAFTALSYLMPLFGGYVASRILDFEHAVILGGILLAAGYALLALPNKHLFFIALAIVTIGTGFFKPSISSYLGDFYDPNAPNREKGYTIFYVGINAGILLSTATSGYLVRYFGWHMPFLTACIGLLVGILTFFFGLEFLKRANHFKRISPSVAHKKPWAIGLVYLSVIILCGLSYEIIQHKALADILLPWGGCFLFAGLIMYAFRYQKKIRNKLLACIVLTLFSIVFWALYFQMFFSMDLFIQRAINRHFFHFVLPAPLFISLQSIYIILLGPFFGMLWQKLSVKNNNISVPMKFALSFFALCIVFLIAYLSTQWVGDNGQSNKLFIVLAYLFMTVGELLLSPIGLAMVTTLAPPEMVGFMMGVFFSSLGFGAKLAGVIANYADIPKTITSLAKMHMIYGDAFLKFFIFSLMTAILSLAVVPFLKKLIASPASSSPQ